jgi:diguanylate cyclase (GGDEF)-like protein
LIIGEIEKGSDVSPVIYFYLSLTEDFKIASYDQDGHEFIAGNKNSPFYELGANDKCKKELEEFLHLVKENGKDRIITFIVDRNEKPCLTDIEGEYLPNEELCYCIKVWNIPVVEQMCLKHGDNVWKYKTLLGLSGQSLMDYDVDKKIVSVYRYVSDHSVREFYDTYDVFIEKIKETAEQSASNLALIEKLGDQFSCGDCTIETTIRTGFFNSEKKVQNVLIRARAGKADNHPMIFGLINVISGDEDNLPFYLTAAGLDSATGLLNKRSIVEYSEHVFNSEGNKDRKHYMVLLDIDDFKSINDNFGHQVGDRAIYLLASVLQQIVGDAGIVGRYGGDEFYILTDRVQDEEKLRSVLRRIKYHVSARAKEELNMEKFNLSMGISLYPDDGNNYKDLLALADKCLYIAKEKGKNRYIIYRPEMHKDIETGAVTKGISSFDEQAKSINRVVKDLFKNGVSAVEKVMVDVVKSFDLDSIDVFYRDMKKPMFSCGKYPSGLSAETFISDDGYMEKFDSNGLRVLNNHTSLRHSCVKVFDVLQEKKCMSLIQLYLVDPDTDSKYFFSCNMLNRNHKWSDAEISNLGLFGSLIFEVVSRQV